MFFILSCDPYFINSTLHGWLSYREQLSTLHSRKYSFAASYEQFMEIIEKTSSVEQLKELRYRVITEISHATAIQHFKQSKTDGALHRYILNSFVWGLQPLLSCFVEHEVQGSSKGDLLRARNLSRYINQLGVCKSFCEKQICLHGGPDYQSYAEPDCDVEASRSENIPSFDLVLDSDECRAIFFKFLARSGHDDLLKFWVAVENMKNLKKVGITISKATGTCRFRVSRLYSGLLYFFRRTATRKLSKSTKCS